jgi:hypothetical protein
MKRSIKTAGKPLKSISEWLDSATDEEITKMFSEGMRLDILQSLAILSHTSFSIYRQTFCEIIFGNTIWPGHGKKI